MLATAGWLAVLGSGEAADAADVPELVAPAIKPPEAGVGEGQFYRLSRRRRISVAATRSVNLFLNDLPPGTDALRVAIKICGAVPKRRSGSANASVALARALPGRVEGCEVF